MGVVWCGRHSAQIALGVVWQIDLGVVWCGRHSTVLR